MNFISILVEGAAVVVAGIVLVVVLHLKRPKHVAPMMINSAPPMDTHRYLPSPKMDPEMKSSNGEFSCFSSLRRVMFMFAHRFFAWK